MAFLYFYFSVLLQLTKYIVLLINWLLNSLDSNQSIILDNHMYTRDKIEP